VPDAGVTATDATDWLVFADASGVGERMAREVRARGFRCTLVDAGDAYQHLEPDRIVVRPHVATDFALLVRELPRATGRHLIVPFMWGLDDPGPDASLAARVVAQRRVQGGALHAVQAMASEGSGRRPIVSFVTRGTQPVHGSEPVSATHATLWGFARSAVLEHRELVCRRIDCDPGAPVDVTSLVDE